VQLEHVYFMDWRRVVVMAGVREHGRGAIYIIGDIPEAG
jgi:hypothetical protein